jgi:hypothetical protein
MSKDEGVRKFLQRQFNINFTRQHAANGFATDIPLAAGKIAITGPAGLALTARSARPAPQLSKGEFRATWHISCMKIPDCPCNRQDIYRSSRLLLSKPGKPHAASH